MEQSGSGNDAVRRLAIRAGIYAGTFLAGALLAFLYSYMPLHNAKNWKIDYLEERVAAKDAEIETLTARLQSIESDSAARPDAETFKLLQDELVTADKTVKRLEGRLTKAEKRTKDLEKSRDKWKSRHEDAKQALASAATATEKTTASVPDDAGESDPKPPAAPAAAGERIASRQAVDVGTRWKSPSGSTDFDLVAIDGGRARVIPNASRLRPGALPETVEVGVGGGFEISAADGSKLDVRIRGIDGDRAIVIDVVGR